MLMPCICEGQWSTLFVCCHWVIYFPKLLICVVNWMSAVPCSKRLGCHWAVLKYLSNVEAADAQAAQATKQCVH